MSEFSVYWWDRNGGQHEEVRFVEAERAVAASRRLAHGPASALGIVERVIITDGGDCCCFEWRRGEGVVFPPAEEKSDAAADRYPSRTIFP
jgi:hypothetical protein